MKDNKQTNKQSQVPVSKHLFQALTQVVEASLGQEENHSVLASDHRGRGGAGSRPAEPEEERARWRMMMLPIERKGETREMEEKASR